MSKKSDPGQLSLHMPEEERPAPKRSKRLRFVKPPETERRTAPKRPRTGEALMQPPVAARCGFCGARLTVMGDAALCPQCGGIVGRPGDGR